MSNKSQENTEFPVLRWHAQGLAALEGVLVVSTQIPAEVKHRSPSCVPLQEGVLGALKGECFLCLHGFLVWGGALGL